MSESTSEHKSKAPSRINFALITVSTSRYCELKAGRHDNNLSGDLIVKLLSVTGYEVVYNDLVPDDTSLIRKSLEKTTNMSSIDAIIMCGGTGVTKTDITIETVTPLMDKQLPGFGEIFRKLSYESIGSAAITTRASAGLINGKVVFCLPGSPQAVEMALKNLVIPEVAHIVKHVRE
jgi:molybdenum cofactor biosynthesis protein B